MKWYWAILLTVAILALFVLIDLPADSYILISAVFAIWVAADSSSFGWGIFVLLLWPIAYPWYLIVRPKVLPGEEQARENKVSQAFKLDQRGDWSQHRPSQSLRFRLSFLFLVTFGAAVLFAFGRVLGVQFVFFMIGVIGFLAAPTVFHTRRAGYWKMMAAVLVAIAWFSAWIMLAGWAVRSGN